MQALELRGEDRRIYLAAVAQIKGLKVRLDVAAREYADAIRLVKMADLRGFGSFYMKHGHAKLKPITVPDLVKEMISTLEQDKRGDYHIRDLDVRLGRFAKELSR